MSVKHGWALAPVSLLSAVVAVATAPVQADDDLVGQIKNGKFGYSFRYRLESVDQDNYVEDALASTLRSRFNFKSGEKTGLGFFVEGDWVLEIGANDFNAGGGNTPDRVQYPVVADPDGLDLNQAYIQWRTDSGTLIRGGRERIIFDNARFVGNVGWRQNEQTFDAVYAQHKAGAAFRTPLATLHAFNGWADKFLGTPKAGLKDLFFGAKGKLGIANWNVVYHEFNAEDGGQRYGTELDASVGTSFAERYGVLLKAAWFDGEPGTVYDDTTKVWIQLTAGF